MAFELFQILEYPTGHDENVHEYNSGGTEAQ